MKITVITVCLNRGYELEKTIQSVLTQTYKNLEYLVIDGGSTDDTHQILQKYKKRLKYISETDQGIYHAMNKGIHRSTGDFLLFLNAGDYFYSNSSLEIMFNNSNGEDLIYGDIWMKSKSQNFIKVYPDLLTFGFFLKETLPHPGTLIKKSFIELTGLFNQENLIVSDWEFFMNSVCKFKATYKHVSHCVSVFYLGGISSDPRYAQLHLDEREIVLQNNYLPFLKEYQELDRCSRELQHLNNSRLHTVAGALMKTSIYKLLKKSMLK